MHDVLQRGDEDPSGERSGEHERCVSADPFPEEAHAGAEHHARRERVGHAEYALALEARECEGQSPQTGRERRDARGDEDGKRLRVT